MNAGRNGNWMIRAIRWYQHHISADIIHVVPIMRFRRLNDLAALKVAFLRYCAFFAAISGTVGELTTFRSFIPCFTDVRGRRHTRNLGSRL